MLVCMPDEEFRFSGFGRIGVDDASLEGHRLWVSQDSPDDVHVVVHLVDWAKAVGLDECGLDEEQRARYQVNVVGLTAELLAAKWLEPVLGPPIVGTSEQSRQISDPRRAALVIGQGLGRLIWVREGNDAGRLLSLAYDVANRHARPISATRPRVGCMDAAS
jgi:hypothetical protein